MNYVNDSEPQVTLKCSFDFPTWDNVSFEIQWFVSGRGLTPTTICDNPNESTCNRRDSLLGTSEYGPGDTVSHGLSFIYYSMTPCFIFKQPSFMISTFSLYLREHTKRKLSQKVCYSTTSISISKHSLITHN